MEDKDFFQFRVANKLFGSNSDKTKTCALNTCKKMDVNLVKYDDSDISCHGYAGFFAKIDLDKKVDVEEFLKIFKEECSNNGLVWSKNGDICLHSDAWISQFHTAADLAKLTFLN